MSKPVRTVSFEEMLATLQTNPILAAIHAKRKAATLTRLKYEMSAIAYGVALKLSDSRSDLEEFYAQEIWINRSYKANKANLLGHDHMFIYGSNEGTEAKRALAHARALQPYFDKDTPIPPAELPDFLADNGGYDGLLKLNALAPDDEDDEPVGYESCGEQVGKGSEDEDDGLTKQVGAHEVPAKPNKPVTAALSPDDTKRSGKGKGPVVLREEDRLKGMKRADIADHLLVRWTDEQREEMMKLEIGDEVVFTVTRMHDDPNGFAIFELIDFA